MWVDRAKKSAMILFFNVCLDSWQDNEMYAHMPGE